MTTNYPLTKEMDFALKQFAERLPEPEAQQPGEVLAPRSGAEIMAEDPTVKDKDGKPLDPTKEYFIVQPHTRVNHLRRLRNAYKTGGTNAVVEYLRPFEKFLAEE